MPEKLKITILADNTADKPLVAEHGFAALVEKGGRRILFDTGQGTALEPNLDALGVEPESFDALVLSHGHYDHTGGIPSLLGRLKPDIAVFAHPEATSAKYALDNGETRYIGAAAAVKCFLSNLGGFLVPTKSTTEIFPGVWATGEIPRKSRAEPPAARFKKDAEGKEIDTIPDDQALFARSDSGTVLLLGCCHAGLENTLDFVADTTKSRKIHAVIGGTHLRSASEERLENSIEALRRHDVAIFAPCHCSGNESSGYIEKRIPDAFKTCVAGTVFEF
jgi:7,8-dihydropterin-6-yl-methyl-4-(beta-D-ribofuranosyl)aminobenzene 5'-phosphate synthase